MTQFKLAAQLPTEISLGITQFTFHNQANDTTFWQAELNPLLADIQAHDSLETIRSNPAIQATKQLYKRLGKDPARFRPSSDSLWRRVVKGKGLYQINALVDLNNLLSLQFKLPIGSYDRLQIGDTVTLSVGQTGETYAGIGKKAVNLEHLLVLRDQDGPFGSPTSDSTRAMITPETTQAALVIYMFDVTAAQAQQMQSETATILNQYLQPSKLTQEWLHR
ncbi:hypothetical protein IV38_GL000440 [Lactobacillus selangorensis]|uniref:B3/B4 tRNA-binding domain-containing protein n=1 Tax=Lactobacillus selangorensis TaxID=81857 RepID=A0A0R2G9A0_9LACO|nr:phenylalanine--tRNA ligase beta subunit-related protein [Lactobacillus selangorensis]KRN29554.1 hypothetical protein IV38_GL000440 [Lactobacillus selangorensis]KRN33916.1 hypothetical protein IV40_GL000228 [Lactobacillus selangorensis]